MRGILLMAATALALSTAGAPGEAHAQDCTGPEADKGSILFNTDFDVFQGCTARGWQAFHHLPPTIDCSDPAAVSGASPGDACNDGSIYAGLSPDGNVPMYTTPADAPSTLTWGSMGTTRGTASVTAGETNTGTLAAFGASAHPAAHYCDSLSAHGSDDWYLPAKDELNVLYTNKNVGALDGTFNETGLLPAGFYWSSSEVSTSYAWAQGFSDGVQGNGIKGGGYAVRCVRR